MIKALEFSARFRLISYLLCDGEGTVPAWSRSASDGAVVCGSLTVCRKDFVTRVQVGLRVCLLVLGSVKQRENLGQKKQQGEPRWCSALASGNVTRKR